MAGFEESQAVARAGKPTHRSRTRALRSGRFVLRLPPRLHTELGDEAIEAGLSLNRYTRLLVERGRQADHQGSRTPPVGLDHSVQQIARRWQASGLVGVVLFGSVARGDSTNASDVDLLLVFSGERPVDRSLYDDWDRSDFDAAMSPQFVNLPERVEDAGSLWYEVSLDGAVLWERDRAISSLLVELRHLVAQGTVQRRLTYGQPYWVAAKRTPK